MASLIAAVLMAPAAQAADRCHPAPSRTEAASRAIRVYRYKGTLLACRLDGGSPQAVTSRRVWGPVDASGTDVAVALSGCDDRGCTTNLRGVRVRRTNARPLRVVYTHSPYAYVVSLVLAGHLAMAWAECEKDAFGDYLCGPDGDSVNSIWVSSRRTPVPVRLDRARGVRARSVRVAGGRIHWRTGSDRRSAPIP